MAYLYLNFLFGNSFYPGSRVLIQGQNSLLLIISLSSEIFSFHLSQTPYNVNFIVTLSVSLYGSLSNTICLLTSLTITNVSIYVSIGLSSPSTLKTFLLVQLFYSPSWTVLDENERTGKRSVELDQSRELGSRSVLTHQKSGTVCSQYVDCLWRH